jgi:hypothetical protein
MTTLRADDIGCQRPLYRELLRGVQPLRPATRPTWWASPPAAPGWPSACRRPGPERPRGRHFVGHAPRRLLPARPGRRQQTQLDFDVNGAT